MWLLNYPDPKDRLTEQPDGTVAFDGSPNELIALIIEDAVATAQKDKKQCN
jgi:hypothetical protein